jgi:hypothetical protein
MTDSTTIVTWLTIIGICSLVQTLLTVALMGVVWQRWRKAIDAFESFRRDHLGPTLEKVDRAVDEVEEIIERLRRVDDQVRDVVSGATQAVGVLSRHMRHRVWPILGAINAARAIVSALAPRKPALRRPDDRDEEARFVYEGGTRYAR